MSALQTVHVRVNDAATGKPTPCRIRFTRPDGTYYAPLGRLTEFCCDTGRDVGGNLWLLGEENKKYAYIDGTCEIQLPPGTMRVEVSKGLEYQPLDEPVELKQGQLSIRLQLVRWCDARQEGWHSGDIHAEHLTPHAALLEGAAEDLAVVNLLARATFGLSADEHPHPAIPNLLAFSGQRPALEMPGHLVVVNTLNWHRRLGGLRLLNCHRIVHPLHFGPPYGSDNWSLMDWCNQCHRKEGLVIGDEYSHTAEILLGGIDAVFPRTHVGELGVFSPRMNTLWDLGLRLPLVAGSCKRSNRRALGQRRTYAKLAPGEELTYQSWIEAIRRGRTFITTGPLLFLQANGQPAGSVLELQEPGQTVAVRVEARSRLRFAQLVLVHDGQEIARTEASGTPCSATIEVAVAFQTRGWLSARCGGPFGAVTSPVYVDVRGRPRTAESFRANEVLQHLERQLSWARTEARCEQEEQRERLAEVYVRARQDLLTRLAGCPPSPSG